MVKSEGLFSKLSKLFKNLFFGKEPRNQDLKQIILTQEICKPGSVAAQRDPYFIQIGFDFGTSYSKCIWRDMMTNKAFVHLCSWSEGYELPFLIPSAIVLRDGFLSLVNNPGTHYPENGLYHLKNALVKVALGQWKDPVLLPFRNVQEKFGNGQLNEFVESCAVFFLSCAFGDIKRKLRDKMPDFGAIPKDYMAINMAVPVADAEQPAVNSIYGKVLSNAWRLTDMLGGSLRIRVSDLEALRRESQVYEDRSLNGICFVYPEVSANVQGFVRSRVSSPGIYLFSDTGGGSVDQSIFIFIRQSDGVDLLTYLTGRVHPIGSSHIERIAAECTHNTDCRSLESWRGKKERGESAYELLVARDRIASKLKQGTESTLASAKRKLFVKEQLSEIKVIFVGGGHCDYPYKDATMYPFSGGLFPRSINPDVIGLPVPRDLELHDHENYWMRRLYVAYGLSFEQNELARFIYPKDVPTPEPEEIWQPRKRNLDFQSKDVC